MRQQNRRICEQETVREGRRILRLLTEEGGHLAPLDDGDFALMSRMTPGAVRIAAGLVDEFRRRDWLAPGAPETFVLSDVGLGWLRRQQAAHEPFAAQHQLRSERMVKDEDGVEHLVVVNDGESPLGWLRRRGIIDAAELEAGERLRRDFTLAQLSPRMGIDLGAPVVDGSRGTAHDVAVADTVIDAKQRFSRAMRAAGPVLSDLLFDVCCHLIGLEAAESARDWPRRTAKVVLQIGLGRLAGHYGLNVRRSRAAMRSWHMECGEELQPSP